ncbi:MAG TPA: TadE family type IV pilus minor pilin, partial [Mycobacterium sp.]|nr:TadE family type IV pilus minor pilin [Mycobacterium sp.]
LVTVLVLAVAGLGALSAQVRCVDAAREAARLAARGDTDGALSAAAAVAPRGATIRIEPAGDTVRARVQVPVPLLPGLAVSATALAAAEPGSRRG